MQYDNVIAEKTLATAGKEYCPSCRTGAYPCELQTPTFAM